MSQSSATIGARSLAAGTNDRTTDGDVLGALTDADCRAILEALGGDERLTAQELSERCDVPLSTTYRKLEQLTDVGLLGERLRIRRSGRHVAEYERRVENVRIDVGGESGLEMRVTCRDSSPQSLGYGLDER